MDLNFEERRLVYMLRNRCCTPLPPGALPEPENPDIILRFKHWFAENILSWHCSSCGANFLDEEAYTKHYQDEHRVDYRRGAGGGGGGGLSGLNVTSINNHTNSISSHGGYNGPGPGPLGY